MTEDIAAQREKREDIASDFTWLVLLAKMKTSEQAARFAIREWRRAKKWVADESRAEGSFLWCCDVFDLDPGAVRKAIEEGKK